jgi:hypothetical protein
MLMRLLATSLLVPLIVVSVACSSDSPSGPSGELTQAEVLELLQVLAQVKTFQPSDSVWACPQGGTVRWAHHFVVDNVEQGTTMSASGTMTYENCGAAAGGPTYTVGGSPNTTIVHTYNQLGRLVSIEGSHSGTLNWNQGGRSGSCLLALTSSGASDEGITSLSVTGTLCDLDIDTSVSII